MQGNSTPRQTDYALLMDYLYEVRHANLDVLSQQPTQTIVEDSYIQFYVFMEDSMPQEWWYSLFRQYVYETINQLGRQQWEADWILRSIEFVRFAASVRYETPRAAFLN